MAQIGELDSITCKYVPLLDIQIQGTASEAFQNESFASSRFSVLARLVWISRLSVVLAMAAETIPLLRSTNLGVTQHYTYDTTVFVYISFLIVLLSLHLQHLSHTQ